MEIICVVKLDTLVLYFPYGYIFLFQRSRTKGPSHISLFTLGSKSFLSISQERTKDSFLCLI